MICLFNLISINVCGRYMGILVPSTNDYRSSSILLFDNHTSVAGHGSIDKKTEPF